jgi:hypothetical protein
MAYLKVVPSTCKETMRNVSIQTAGSPARIQMGTVRNMCQKCNCCKSLLGQMEEGKNMANILKLLIAPTISKGCKSKSSSQLSQNPLSDLDLSELTSVHTFTIHFNIILPFIPQSPKISIYVFQLKFHKISCSLHDL